MFNFEYQNPTKIVFGKDRIGELNNLVPENARVLILYGQGSVKKYGTLDKVKSALGNRKVFEFSGIEPNPEYETLLKAVDSVKKNKIDFLLALGGGSVMDGTKFVAAAALYQGEDCFDILKGGLGGAQGLTKTMPIGTVVTLPATGSEVNGNAVISRREYKSKMVLISPLLYPQFSIIDPELTYTLPARQVANGIIDTYVHVIEQYLNKKEEARVQDRFSEGILLTLTEVGEKTIAEPENYDARANLVWSATAAMNGMISAGVSQDWLTHLIGHEITALYGLDHAQTLAIILPSVMNVCREDKHEKLLQYAERIWNLTEGDENSRIDCAIERTRQFFESLGVKTYLSDYGIDSDQVNTIMQQLEDHGVTNMLPKEPMKMVIQGALSSSQPVNC